MSHFQRIEDREKWKDLLGRALFKTFFHSLDWEEFLEDKLGWLKFERYLYKEEAILSLAKVKISGKERFISHPFCEYGGPLPLVGKANGEQFKEDLLKEIKADLRINLHPQLLNYFSGFESGSLGSWRGTYWIENLSKSTKEQLLSSFRYDTRHSIKEAKQQGFTFEECQLKDDLREFHQLYLGTMRRHKNIPLPFSFFEFFWKSSKIFFIKSKGKIITGSIFLFYKPFIHYFITASDDKFRRSGANHLLLWEVIQRYLDKDFYFLPASELL